MCLSINRIPATGLKHFLPGKTRLRVTLSINRIPATGLKPKLRILARRKQPPGLSINRIPATGLKLSDQVVALISEWAFN